MKKASSSSRSGWVLTLVVALVACGGAERDTSPKHPNVFVLVVDGIHADEIARTPSLAPTIDRIAAEGMRFASSTLASMDGTSNLASLLTSLPPERHRVRGEGGSVGDDVMTIAEVFRERGFATAAFGEAAIMNSIAGIEQGFERFVAVEDDTIDARLASWLAERKADAPARPFFVYAHIAATSSTGVGRERSDSLAQASARAGRILAAVQGFQTENQTITVVTSTRNGRLDRTRIPREVDLGVPLIFHQPKRLAAGVVHEHVARTMDLGPTLMMLAKVRRPEGFGFTHPAYSLAMRDLVEILVGIPRGTPMSITGEGRVGGDEVRWFEVSGYRIVRRTDAGGHVQHAFYNTAEDPEHQNDLIESEAQRALMYELKLDAWISICESEPEVGSASGG